MTAVSARQAQPGPFVAPAPRRTRRPSWLDLRLVSGVVLVLVAVLAGSFVVQSADHRRPVWQLSRNLPAGTVIRPQDVRAVKVQLGSAASSYIGASEAVVGRALLTDARSGELLSAAELTAPREGVTVTVPALRANTPSLSRGDRITMWVTTKSCRAVVVISGVGVTDVKQDGGSGLGSGDSVSIVLTLDAPAAARVITALDLASAVIRVGVLAAGQPAAAVADLGQCVGTAG